MMEAFWGTAVLGFLVAFLPVTEWLEQLLRYVTSLVMSWRFVIYDVEQSTMDHVHQADESMQAIATNTPNELFHAVQLHLGEKLSHDIHNIDKIKADAEEELCFNAVKPCRRRPWSSWLAPQPVIKVGMAKGDSKLSFSLGTGQYVDDTFQGKRLRWHAEEQKPAGPAPMVTGWNFLRDRRDTGDTRLFRLRLLVNRRDDEEGITYPYLQHIIDRSKSIAATKKQRLLFTNLKSSADNYEAWAGRRHMWASVPFRHPGTFDTLAIDPGLKDRIIRDLVDFADAAEFYRTAGRAWKRGYLLYGPPGTGKSTLIAAIANFMNYDVYDLELSQVRHNGHLKNLLVKTSNKSVVVIEDIDCALTDTTRAVDNDINHSRSRSQLDDDDSADDVDVDADDPNDDDRRTGQRFKLSTRLTFSGLLSFTDGLWSSCGGERIFIFTTNNPERLDPALLRPGRMDMHIHLSYCTYEAFKVLALNYLGLQDHSLFKQVEMAMDKKGAQITPAQVCELLIRDRRDPKKALQILVAELENKLSGRSSV